MTTFVDLDSIWRDRVAYPNPCDYTVTETQVSSWMKYSSQPQYTSLSERSPEISVTQFTLPYPRIELFADVIASVDSAAGATLNAANHVLVNGNIVECLDTSTETTPFTRGTQYEVVNTVAGVSFELKYIGGGASVSITANKSFTGRNKLRFALVTATVSQQLSSALSLLSLPRLYLDFHCNTYNDLDLVNTISGINRTSKFIVSTSLTSIQNDEYNVPLWIHYSTDMKHTLRFKKNDAVKIRICDRAGKALTFFNDTDTSTEMNPLKQTLITLCLKNA